MDLGEGEGARTTAEEVRLYSTGRLSHYYYNILLTKGIHFSTNTTTKNSFLDCYTANAFPKVAIYNYSSQEGRWEGLGWWVQEEVGRH